jgi:hypothetical protein
VTDPTVLAHERKQLQVALSLAGDTITLPTHRLGPVAHASDLDWMSVYVAATPCLDHAARSGARSVSLCR